MILRLLADADLKGGIVSGVVLRIATLDFRRAEHVPLEGLDDQAVLQIAASDRRILVSHDENTMQMQFRQFISRRASPGLIIIPQSMSIGAAVEKLVFVCEALDPPDLVNRICLFPALVIFGF